MKVQTKDILRLERFKRRMTQEDVANYLNIGRASYAHYETGDNMPTTENLMKLSVLYQVPTDYLLCHDFKAAMKQNIKSGFEEGQERGEEFKNKRRVRKKKEAQ